MIRNYLKIAWRNLIRNPLFSLINIMGLSIGLAVTGLIFLWMSFELGFDRFHEHSDRIYEVNNQYPVDGEIWTWNTTPKVMAPAIREDYPEVEQVARVNWNTPFLFSNGDIHLKASGNVVDPEFLKIFSYPLVKGNIDLALAGVNSVVLTETFARRLFGDADPMGKEIVVDNQDPMRVTGILKDLPANTDFSFEYLMPWAYMKQKGWDDSFWGNNSVQTYVMLRAGTDYDAFSQKIAGLRARYDEESPDMKTLLYPFSRTYLYGEFENGKETGGRIVIIRMFGIIALSVLLIACINFMNLSTARSMKRAREVGIRKVVGARKQALIGQFLGESLMMSVLAALLAVPLVKLALPAFNTLVDRPLELDSGRAGLWLGALAIIVVTGLLAGSYPALYLSSFRPTAVLKGTFKKVNALVTPRKVLVVVQFTAAIVMITSTLIVRQQISNAQNRNLGYARNNLIYVFMEGDVEKNFPLIREELLRSGTAVSVTKTGSPITESWSNSWDLEWPGKSPEDKTLLHRLTADDAVAATMGLQLAQGRDFDLGRFPTDSTAMLINEAAAAHMGLEEPLGQIVKDNRTDWHIVGVVKDFVFNSPFRRVEPMVIEGAAAWFNVIHIKFAETGSMAANLEKTGAVFNKFNPEYPFDYQFVDQNYAEKFSDVKRTEKLAALFALLTILISCLGLFGLAAYMAENRVKEIGIRKVLGASMPQLIRLLSDEFVKLILVSLLLAIPVSWYLMSHWLDNYEFRITISWWVFGLAGLLTLLIALLTVSSQALRAGRANPVNSLRTE